MHALSSIFGRKERGRGPGQVYYVSISGGIGAAVGPSLNSFTDELAGRSLIGGFTGGIAAVMYGADFGQGFVNGAKTVIVTGSYLMGSTGQGDFTDDELDEIAKKLIVDTQIRNIIQDGVKKI